MSRAPGTRGGICAGTGTVTRIVSPKVHPAPSPPVISPQNDLGTSSTASPNNANLITRSVEWPSSAMSTRVKKLSWDDDSQTKVKLMNTTTNGTNYLITLYKYLKIHILTIYYFLKFFLII